MQSASWPGIRDLCTPDMIYFVPYAVFPAERPVGVQPEASSFYAPRVSICELYRGADKSLARPTSRYILFDGENISFDASLAIYVNSTNIPPIVIINRIFENQKLLSL